MLWLLLFLAPADLAHAQVSQAQSEYVMKWGRFFSAGPYFSGQFGLVLAYNKCHTQVLTDCFFWTPPGCDGVTENPVLSNFGSWMESAGCYPQVNGDVTCFYYTYCNGLCTANCYIEKPEPPDPTDCPIIIPMGADRQVRLTDLARGVLFDIDADGDQERISWTDPRSNTVFLALDRNGDGVVTDGGELFGNRTVQPPSAEPNGFNALAEFDTDPAGGNGDGVISELDAVFASLLLWHDANHDGQSQLEELRTLPQSGLIEIELRYHESQRRDQFGNLLRYHAKVMLVGGHTKAVDVFFLGE